MLWRCAPLNWRGVCRVDSDFTVTMITQSNQATAKFELSETGPILKPIRSNGSSLRVRLFRSWRMRKPWIPSIVPNAHDETVYLVLEDFGRNGRAWRETDVERSDLETVITDLMSGQYASPVTVVAFNLAERWANDVSKVIAREIQMRADLAHSNLSLSLDEFVERHTGRREP